MSEDTFTICCIGAGYVGGPTMTMIACKNPSIRVIVVDINKARIDAWQTGAAAQELPIYEPGLFEKVQYARDEKKNLVFSTAVDESIAAADMVFVSVNTPTKKTGVGAGKAADLKYWDACARQIARVTAMATTTKKKKIVVEKSTLPVRTGEAMQRVLESNAGSGTEFHVLSNPEFLAEGTAIRDLEAPDRVLIGGEDAAAKTALVEIYRGEGGAWVPADKIITTNLWSAELSKLAANAFLAQRISSINAISALCEVTGADVNEVARAIGSDSRIGPHFLRASVGFGGSCFQKDILNLVHICAEFGLPEVSAYWEQVVAMNDYQKSRFSRRILRDMFNTVSNKKIVLFGFAFKKDTGDTRETASVFVAMDLIAEGAEVIVYDPQVKKEHMLWEFAEHGADRELVEKRVTLLRAPSAPGHVGDGVVSPVDACAGAHAIAIMTEWDQFRDAHAVSVCDYAALFDVMEKPAFVFDGRAIVDNAKLTKLGFQVYTIGQGDCA